MATGTAHMSKTEARGFAETWNALAKVVIENRRRTLDLAPRYRRWLLRAWWTLRGVEF